jgi:hypothetical protein
MVLGFIQRYGSGLLNGPGIGGMIKPASGYFGARSHGGSNFFKGMYSSPASVNVSDGAGAAGGLAPSTTRLGQQAGRWMGGYVPSGRQLGPSPGYSIPSQSVPFANALGQFGKNHHEVTAARSMPYINPGQSPADVYLTGLRDINQYNRGQLNSGGLAAPPNSIERSGV